MEHTWVDVAWNASEDGELGGTNRGVFYRVLQDRVDAFSTGVAHYERFLGTVYDNDLTKSNKCKTECIDKNLVFCSSEDYTAGTCYDPNTESVNKINHCSNDNPNAPKMFRLWVCPNEPACESRFMTPTYDGEVLRRTVDKYTYSFVRDDVCAY